MNASQLLQHFDRISEAPDAVPRLRRFVLDLAVRGKLVEQDLGDQPATKLLERLHAKRTQLVRQGKRMTPPAVVEDGQRTEPFPVPTAWTWCRLSEVGAIVGGGTPPSGDADNFASPGTGTAWLTPADLGKHKDLFVSRGARDLTAKGQNESSATVMPKGSVLFTSRAPIGYTAIAANEISTNQGFKSVVPYVAECNLYVATYFRAFATWINDEATGTTFREVSGKTVANLPFPLPPLREQHRIVARVDELMALCDRLEKAQAEREGRRDRLTAACHARLNRPDPETFQEDARFTLTALPAVTTRSDQIEVLRRAILSLAIRGLLVPQDPNNEPASALLKRVEEKRTVLLKSGYPNQDEARTQIKKLAEQTVPKGLEALPVGWSWATLLHCSALVIDCLNKTPPYSRSGIRLIRTTNVREGRLNQNQQKFVDDATYARWSARCTPEPGDILITREAPMGEVCRIPPGQRICLGQRMMLARLVPGTIDPDFMIVSLRDPKLMDRVQDKPIGATVQHLRVGGVETLLVPVPPLSEQRRIVAKVDELMAVCDRLEAQLATAQTESRRLLEAVLHEALAAQSAGSDT